MADRITQVAREALQKGGNPNARITQVAREVLVRVSLFQGSDTVAPATTETARLAKQTFSSSNTVAAATSEVATLIFTTPAADVRETQAALEWAADPPNSIQFTTGTVEYNRYPPNSIQFTTGTVEYNRYPPNEVRLTTGVVEVVLAGPIVPTPPTTSSRRIIPQYIKRRNSFGH